MFPVETISAKMLDYYVGRRDTLIIDLREKESYMHSHVKGAVNMPYGEIDGYTVFPRSVIGGFGAYRGRNLVISP